MTKPTKNLPATTKKAPKPAAKAPTIKTLDDIKPANSRRSVGAIIKAEQAKMVKSAKATLVSYCAIGEQLQIAKAAIEADGQSFASFMKTKPLGLAYSTAQRYIAAATFGAAKMVERFEQQGGEALNFKNLLSDVTEKDREEKGKAPHAGRKPRAAAPKQEPSDALVGSQNIPCTDARLDMIIDADVPRMSAKQLQRLALAVSAQLDELTSTDIIEGELEREERIAGMELEATGDYA